MKNHLFHDLAEEAGVLNFQTITLFTRIMVLCFALLHANKHKLILCNSYNI